MYGNRRPSLRGACRIMLGIWLVLVLCMSVVVGKATQTETAGNLIAFLFTSKVQIPVRPLAPPPVALPAEQEPVQPEPVAAPVPVPSPWTPYTQGNIPAEGTLGEPTITIRADGQVEVLLPYTGKAGHCKIFVPHGGIPALSTDLYGTWKKKPYINKRLDSNSILSRLQIAGHDGLLRVSGTGRESGPPLQVEASYSSENMRLVFSHLRGGN